MSGLRFFKPISSAPVARERLLILLEHERHLVNPTDLFAALREHISAMVGRHVTVDPDRARVREVCGATVLTIAVDIEIPHRVHGPARPAHGGEIGTSPLFR